MKRVFLFLMSALVCGTMMTSCNDDDDDNSVALTGITVSQENVKLPVGEIQRVTVKSDPENATGVTYTWTSANENVATVNAEGIVRIEGVGTTTVTVTTMDGTFTKTIAVEGLIKSLTLKDGDQTSGTYPYNGVDITFTITATADPVANVDVVWSSNVGHVTVVANENSMSATVTVSGLGDAVITAKSDDREWTYSIATTSLFESAVGYWNFEDDDLGKAVLGSDLKYTPSQFKVVAGPSDNKKAVRIVHDNSTGPWRGTDVYQGLLWNHGLSGEQSRNYTVLMDSRISAEYLGNYYIVYSANNEGNETGGVAAVSFRARDDGGVADLTINQGGGNAMFYARKGTFKIGDEPWVRLVFTVTDTYRNEKPDVNWACRIIINGKIGDEELDKLRPGNNITNYVLQDGVPVRFLMAAGSNEANNAYDVSTIAVWDRVLTDDEIAALSGVSK